MPTHPPTYTHPPIYLSIYAHRHNRVLEYGLAQHPAFLSEPPFVLALLDIMLQLHDDQGYRALCDRCVDRVCAIVCVCVWGVFVFLSGLFGSVDVCVCVGVGRLVGGWGMAHVYTLSCYPLASSHHHHQHTSTQRNTCATHLPTQTDTPTPTNTHPLTHPPPPPHIYINPTHPPTHARTHQKLSKLPP
jgi:hypothetical protein